MVPATGSRANRSGRAPAVIKYEYGAVPPLPLQLAPVYGTPTCAVGKTHVTRRATLKLNSALPVSGVEELSVTVTVNVKVPAVVGVPVMVPATGSRVNRSG